MAQIGLLIPEFPGQTHAFFIRERRELDKLALNTVLISTRQPLAGAGAATHEWAAEAAKETQYLFPMGAKDFLLSCFTILLAGPCAWWRCGKCLWGPSDMGIGERLKMLVMIIAGAYLKRVCIKHNLSHVHVHSCANAANVAMFAYLLRGPSYSMTLHGPLHDYGNNQANKWRHAAYCVVITQDLMAQVKDKIPQLPPLYLAPMGVRVDDFQRSTPYQPYRPGDQLNLVACGRLHFSKAHDDLIRVVALLKEQGIQAELRICGTIDSKAESSGYYQQLQSLRQELGVEEQVHFLGSVAESQVKQELQDAHFFCLASLREPLGVATMEAMAMEIPAIVTRSPGVVEMVEDGVDGVLVEPRAPDTFVSAIKALIADPDRATAIAKAGRRKIADRYHSGVSASKILEGFNTYGKH